MDIPILSRNLLRSFFERAESPALLEASTSTAKAGAEAKATIGLSTYVPERTYHAGEVTIYNGTLLYALTDTTGAFNSSHWQKVFALGSVTYRGTWNAAENMPPLRSSTGTKGDYYIVSSGGSTILNDITTWAAGDWAIYNGTSWERVINEG